jgi:hypothetical protein
VATIGLPEGTSSARTRSPAVMSPLVPSSNKTCAGEPPIAEIATTCRPAHRIRRRRRTRSGAASRR